MLHRIAVATALVTSVLLLIPACSSPSEPISSAAPAPGLSLPPGAEQAAESIDGATLERLVADLSDDSMEGRGPATEGDRLARTYIADYLARLGLEPGGVDGSWEQPIGLVGLTAHPPETWTFRHGEESVDLDWSSQYIASAGRQEARVRLEDRELVFVGYGITAPEEDWDDFKGADLAGKVLVMMNNDPEWDEDLFAGYRRLFYGRWTYKYESAAKQGAAGAIIIHTTPSAGYGWQVVQSSWTGEQFQLPAGDEPRLALEAWVTEDAARNLVSLAGHDLDQLRAQARTREFRPVPLGVTTSIEFENTVAPGSPTANVLGLLPGRDPALRDQVVVYTAHHDHLGIGEPDESGDRIYNGARDNASGVATVLSVAKAFAALPEPPRRSVLFLLVAAEEQGLLGSKYYAANPTVHPGKITANLNTDSAAIFGASRDVAVIGKGKSGLEDLLEVAAALQDRIVVDEPFPDKGSYYRSDQFNFAKIGVPALYFKSGTELVGYPPEGGHEVADAWREAHYHQPSDEINEAWSFEGMVLDAKLNFFVGLAVAEADDPPGWKPGDEFESVRQRMLAEVEGR